MRKAEAYLLDILEAAERAVSYVAGMKRADFLLNEMAKAAVVREIEIMGEAASRLSNEFREAHADVPWSELTRLRNFYIHVYHSLDYALVWRTATVTVPRIATAVRTIIPPLDSGEAEQSDAS